MEPFGAPAMSDEFAREPIEQFGVARRFSPQSEIARRSHKPGAEMVHPNSIDPHSGGERIVRRGDGIGQLQPTAAMFEIGPFRRRKGLKKAWRRHIAFRRGVAATENMGVLPPRPVGQRDCERRGDGRLNQPAIDFALQPPKGFGRRRIEVPLGRNNWFVGNNARRISRVQNLPYSLLRVIGQCGRVRLLRGKLRPPTVDIGE